MWKFTIFFLFQHGNAVRQKWLDLVELIAEGKTKQRTPNFEVPERELPCRFNVQPGTWFARDNVFNFILFCRKLGKVGVHFYVKSNVQNCIWKFPCWKNGEICFHWFFFTFLQYQPHNFALENQQTGHLAFCRIFYVKNHKAYPGAAARLL